MSNTWNQFFSLDTKGYLKEHFMTAVGMQFVPAGPRQFDIHHEVVRGYKIARIDAWDASSRDDEPLNGYWVPQGKSCVIPRTANRSHFVFTPDFSGCSILVDQIDPYHYRVYHVQGSKANLKHEYLTTGHPHGLGLAAAMTFGDYGAACLACRTRCGREQTRGFAFLKFEGDRWWIYAQGQDGVGLGYQDGQYRLTGPQTPAGGVRIPVADLTCEVPRVYARHDGETLPPASVFDPSRRNPARRGRIFARMLPNDDLW